MGDPVLQKWQRDLNCVGDADRSTRQRALSRFDDALGTGRGASADLLVPGARSRLVAEGLLAALLLRLSDPVEKNRELALHILWQLVEQDQCGGAAASSPGHALEPAVVASVLSEAVRVGESRLCEVPFPESSEELRLRWLELLSQLVAHPACRGALGRELGALCRIVGKCSADAFPDCKRQCALLVSQLCARAPEKVHLQLEALLVPTVGSLAHQHAKVRQSALDAVKSLVLTCCETSSNFDELMRERVLPAVRKVNHDRASAVRIQGIQLVSDLLLKMPCSHQYRKDLLPIALFGLADPAAQIQDTTLATVESVGERLTAEQQAQTQTQEREREREHEHELAALSLWDDLELPEPFKRRPGRGARELVVQTLPSALPALLKEATDWTAAERFRAVALLRCMLVFAEGSVAPLAPAILETLFAVFGDDEPTIAAAARDCSRLLGRFLAPSQLLSIVLPACLGVGTRAGAGAGAGAGEAVLLEAGAPGAATVAADTGSRRLGALAVLASAVRGLPGSGALPEQLGDVAEALAQPALGDSEAANVQAAVLRAAQAVLDRQLQALGAGGASLSVLAECRLLRTLLLLATSAADADGKAGLHAEAEVALALLAATAGCLDTAGAPDVPRFCELRCRLLLPVCVAAGGDADTALVRLASGDSGGNKKQQVLVDAAVCGEWTKARPERRLLDQLVRRVGLGGLERAGQLPLVVAVLLATAPAERDADLRLCMLALLETIISSGLAPGAGGAALDRFLPQIVLQVLLPGLVWRAGRVSSTIRKVSTFCLSRLVRLAADPGAAQQQQQQQQQGQQQQQARTHWYAKELPRMLPTLKGCLDDQEADTRRFACDCLAGMCQLVARAGLELDAFAVTDTYHDVVKRLDDADDGVRVAGCGALAALLAAAPPMAIKGTVAGYVADACFIHLDDPAAQVQEAVFHVLKTLLDKPVDADMIKDKARTHRARHRNPHFCDLITSN